MVERIKAWQCVGCGRVESPQPCIGVCQDRKIELVDADELELAQARTNALEAVVRMLAQVTPRDGEWERSYRHLQERARLLLDR